MKKLKKCGIIRYKGKNLIFEDTEYIYKDAVDGILEKKILTIIKMDLSLNTRRRCILTA